MLIKRGKKRRKICQKKKTNQQKTLNKERKIIDKRHKIQYNTYSKEKDRSFLLPKMSCGCIFDVPQENGFFMLFAYKPRKNNAEIRS